MRRLYCPDEPDDINDRPDDWEDEGDLPAEACPMSEEEVRRVADMLGLTDLDAPGVWWCDPLDVEIDEPFDSAAE